MKSELCGADVIKESDSRSLNVGKFLETSAAVGLR
jgi:hypothetical protein